jgi:hypothetical protein
MNAVESDPEESVIEIVLKVMAFDNLCTVDESTGKAATGVTDICFDEKVKVFIKTMVVKSNNNPRRRYKNFFTNFLFKDQTTLAFKEKLYHGRLFIGTAFKFYFLDSKYGSPCSQKQRGKLLLALL